MPFDPVSGRSASLPAGKGIRASGALLRRADASSVRIDEAGRIRGYASLFGVMDLGRDIVLPGAFRESVTRRGAQGIRLLWQHDPGTPIGHWSRIDEDRHGLFVEGQLDLDLPRARDLESLIRRGSLDGLSIGYRSQSERHDPATGIRSLEKIDLWEVSLVTFPLLPQARLMALKGLDRTISGVASTAYAVPRRIAAIYP